jgi:hypothetical protein
MRPDARAAELRRGIAVFAALVLTLTLGLCLLGIDAHDHEHTVPHSLCAGIVAIGLLPILLGGLRPAGWVPLVLVPVTPAAPIRALDPPPKSAPRS